MKSTITIADIIADPSLDTRLVSGAKGVDRAVLWAHSCEMPEPARWLGPHELLMTIGLCVPSKSQAQREFVASLDEAGLAGITVGDDDLAPRLTRAMLEESEARGFPVLATGHNTPFAAIGRTVAAANANRQTMDVLVLAKLYQVVAAQSPAERRTGKPLRDLFRTDLQVIDDATGCVVVGNGVLGREDWRRYPLRTHRATQLTVSPGAQLDGFSLVHLTQVLAVDANAILQEATERVREKGATLDSALAGRPDQRLTSWLADGKGHVAYRAIVTDSEVENRIPLAIVLSGLDLPTTRSNGRTILISPLADVEPVREILRQLSVAAGVSSEHHDLGDLAGAIAEASSEFSVAVSSGEQWREFHGERVSLLARSRTESALIVQTVLGPVATNEPRYVPLRETLFTFLDHDLSWKDTADALGTHRQTIVYRLNQIETLTGRSVRRTKDVSELWLARVAWDHLKGRT
ncbi:PucR family transcriptional regulator [Arthrobacter sp. NyZ413]|uniref:PucR family transcriptional regulator n=1 Tax=Arthrobacter sp. NyZ413 TaxID=3144669 RepID=UPI003BF824AA